MATQTAKLLSDALELPRAERAELATQLLRRLDEEPELDEAAWARELERRAGAVADGSAELVSWDDMRESLRSELRTRRDAAGR